MSDDRRHLLQQLKDHYRTQGWPVTSADDEVLHATGPGGVTWHGTAVTASEVSSAQFERLLLELSERRMPRGGELCPVDLLAADDCQPGVRALLERLRLNDRPHVSLYSAAG